jgi:Inner membrane protein YgaP-like, transmembrane domain
MFPWYCRSVARFEATMHTNVGATDAKVRWALAAVFFAVAIAFNASPVITLVAALAALVLASTALTRSCPLYRLMGIHPTPPKIPAPRG